MSSKDTTRRRHAGNCALTMTGFDDRDLDDVVRLAFGGADAVAFTSVGGELAFVSLRIGDKWTALPCPMSAEEALPMIRKWLSTAERGRDPGHDGSNSAGWTVSAGAEWPLLCIVKPEWLEHHK